MGAKTRKTAKNVLELLRQNSRRSNLSIAKELDISEGGVRQHISRLKESGTIQRFTVQTKTAVGAIIGIRTEANTATSTISQEIKKEGALRIFEVAGKYEIVCYLEAESLTEVNDHVEKIRAINGVKGTETLPVLKEI